MDNTNPLIPINPNPIMPTENLSDIITRDVMDIKESQPNDPAYTPKRFKEQFHFKDDGSLWININNNWVKFGVSTASGMASRASSSTGAQKISCGFRPKIIKITAQSIASGTDNNGTSTATGDANSINNLFRWHYTTGNVWVTNSRNDYIIYVVPEGTGDRVSSATLQSIDDDSFTLNWTYAGVLCRFIWEAYG